MEGIERVNRFLTLLRPIIAVRVARPIGPLQRVNKRRNERLDFLLGNDDTQNFDLGGISHLAHVVSKTSIPRKTKIVPDGDLPVECAVIEALEFQMIHRINLVAEGCQSSEQRLRHVLVEKDFHLAPATQNGLILPTLR